MNEIENWYDNEYEEWDRLDRHKIEFEITKRYLDKYIIKPESKIFDIGGGPGRYSISQYAPIQNSLAYLTFDGYKGEMEELCRNTIWKNWHLQVWKKALWNESAFSIYWKKVLTNIIRYDLLN